MTYIVQQICKKLLPSSGFNDKSMTFCTHLYMSLGWFSDVGALHLRTIWWQFYQMVAKSLNVQICFCKILNDAEEKIKVFFTNLLEPMRYMPVDRIDAKSPGLTAGVGQYNKSCVLVCL